MTHRYKNNGYNIILDVNSGSVHVVDEIVYDMIALVEPLVNEGIKNADTIHAAVLHLGGIPYPDEEIAEAVLEVLELEKAGQLFSPDIYESYVPDFQDRQTVVKALCLHVAHDCNLACGYCFAQEGKYQKETKAFMSFEVGRKALDYLITHSGNRTNLEVDFFGGEPLMNWQVVKQLVEYGRSLEEPYHKKFRFTLTTNGVLLNDDIIEFANREMYNIVFSLDGRKEVHDRMRPLINGQGSYDTVVPKICKAVKSRGKKDYYVRGTYTRHNMDFTEDVLHLAELGFQQISIEPVVTEPNESYGMKEEDLPRLKEEYDRLACEMIKRHFNFFHFMIDLGNGPCIAKRLAGCGMGTEYLAVTPWGDLYPCHQFVGNEDYLLGNLDTGIIRNDLQEKLKGCNIYTKEKCRKCFARFYCSGGCVANAVRFGQDLNGVDDISCELQRKRVECAIMLKAAQM